MIHDLKPYPAYKDSGVPWLGKVPEHWEVKRNKLFLREINERSEDGSEELLTVSQYTGVTARRERISEENGLLTNAASLVGYKRVNPGDLIMNIMLAWNGSLGVSPIAGIASPAYCVYRATEEIESRFLHYLFRTPLFTGVFKAVSTGVIDSRLRLYPEVFFRLISILPPKEEQSAIVRYLDYVDRRIRRYIRAKQKLIKLLEEKKQAIIHQAVTRGLDPNVKLKPSGVEWLGDVPEHWEIVNLGRLIQLTTGFPFKSEGFSQNTDDIRLLRGINVSPDRIHWDSVVYWSVADFGLYSSYSLKVGNIVLGMDRPVISAGIRVTKVQSEDVPSLLLQRVCRLRPTTKLNNKYMLLLLRGRSFSNYLAPIFTGISVPHISPEQICSFRIVLPSINEQLNIVEWVRQNTSKIELAVDSARREIFLLREYRTRLIADVVTGKLDVREAAANLPEETDEIETFDDVLAEDEELESNEIEDEQVGEFEEEVLA